jgi:hypothetical protein
VWSAFPTATFPGQGRRRKPPLVIFGHPSEEQQIELARGMAGFRQYAQELGGRTRGRSAQRLIGSTNRDPQVFADPERFEKLTGNRSTLTEKRLTISPPKLVDTLGRKQKHR